MAFEIDLLKLISRMRTAFLLLEKKVNPETGLLFNYTDDDYHISPPTAEECRMGMPNHNGWHCPTEDGAYYSGLYLDALCCRWKYAKDEKAAQAAIRVAAGLCTLSEIGPDGFVARSYTGPDLAHFSCGSDDQTFPWFYGLWRFLHSGLGDDELNLRICRNITRVGNALYNNNFRIPSDPVNFGIRGDYLRAPLRDICKLLFICLVMRDITKDEIWTERYEAYLYGYPEGSDKTRLSIVLEGSNLPEYDGESVFYCIKDGQNMEYVFGKKRKTTQISLFLRVMANIAINALCELDKNTERVAMYRKMLCREVKHALTHIGRFREIHTLVFPEFNGNWRLLRDYWKPQTNTIEAGDIAWQQHVPWAKICPRAPFENAFVREPLFAACIAALSADSAVISENISLFYEILTDMPYEKLNSSTFYAALLLHGQLMRAGIV